MLARSIGTLTRKGSKWPGIARPKRHVEGPNDEEWQVGFVTHEGKAAENPVYVTRMPGGVTGKAREGLPMSIFI